MDPLSDVLALLKPQDTMCGGFNVGGDWSFQFPRHDGIKCYALVSGSCWLAVDGLPDAVRLSAGDCFLLPLGRPFRLASDPALEPVDYRALHPGPATGGVRTWNGGGDVFGVGGYFGVAGRRAAVLLGAMPPIVHVRGEADRAALRWSIERMMRELREPQPGGLLVLRHLAHLLLVQALRAYLADGTASAGWLSALADEQVGPALSAMHADPAHPWTLQELAERAGMSRSAFAQRFKAAVGGTPIDYLIRWRMLLAGDRLTGTGDSIAAVARSLGYESESAFGTAFKRVMGSTPRRYGRAHDPAAGTPQ